MVFRAYKEYKCIKRGLSNANYAQLQENTAAVPDTGNFNPFRGRGVAIG